MPRQPSVFSQKRFMLATRGCVAKTQRGGQRTEFRCSSAVRSEQFCDERRLSQAVSFASSLNLPLPDHIHHFISSQCSPSRLERKEAHAWFDQSFEKAMILFHQIVEIFALSKFTRYCKNLCCLQFLESFGVCRIFVDGNDARRHCMRGSKHFHEKAFGCLSITSGTS
jgi:hypothetical protein